MRPVKLSRKVRNIWTDLLAKPSLRGSVLLVKMGMAHLTVKTCQKGTALHENRFPLNG